MGTHDIWQNYWNFWWWETALLERGQSPYQTDMIFHPVFKEDPAYLGCHTHSPGNIILSLPLISIFGIPVALNLAIFAGFLFASFGTYLLAREYAPAQCSIGRWAPFIAGVVFAYFPQHVEQSLEHLNLASIHGMPLFLWAMVRLLRRGGGMWIILTGVFFALNSLFSWHNGLMVIPMALGVILFECFRGPRKISHILLGLLLAALVSLILVSPFLYQLIETISREEAIFKKASPIKPIDPLFLITPHSGHPFWGNSLASIYGKFRGYPSVGFMAYLGIVAVALAMMSPLSRRTIRRHAPTDPIQHRPHNAVWLWIFLAAFFLLLSLGEYLRIARHDFQQIPMPFAWLKSIPIFGIVRVPNRFLVPAVLSIAILVALGSGAVATLLPERFRKLFFVILTALMITDYLWIPYPMREIPHPEWLTHLEKYPKDQIVLDIPSGHRARASMDMLYQTFHGHPIASGYTATPLIRVNEMLNRFPVLRQIFERYPSEEAFKGPTLSETIRQLGIGIIVLHLNRSVDAIRSKREEIRKESPNDLYKSRIYNPETGTPRATLEKFREELRSNFGEPVAVEEGVVEIYLNPL